MNGKDKTLLATGAVTLALVAFLSFSTLRAEVEDFEERVAKPHPARQVSTIQKQDPLEAKVLELATKTEGPAVEPAPEPLGTFQLTAYCDCEQCCGEWADGYTYTGTVATAGRTVAVDPDVIPLGSSVYIEGQEYIAEDIGGAIQGNRVDVFFNSHADALEFGVQYAEVSVKY